MTRRSTGHIRKLPSGRFQASYIGPDQTRHAAPRTFTARMDAEGWLRDERRMIENSEWKAPFERVRAQRRRDVSPTFAEFAEQWVSTRRTAQGRPIRDSTAAGYRSVLAHHLLPILGNVRLTDMTAQHVRDWYRGLDQRKPRMASKAYGQLRAIMNSAVDDELISASPVHIRGAGATAHRRKLEPATLNELQVIAESMPVRFQLMIWLASWCALRYGEIVELRRSDIRVSPDAASALIRVRRGVVFLKGAKQVTAPKSDAGVRDVAMPPHLIPMLVDHLQRHAARGANGLLFPADGGGHLWSSVMQKYFRLARERAGRPDLRFHDLRHTGAVLAAQQGATIADLQARLGHSTAAAALLYQHTAAGRDQLIAQRLSQLVE